MAYLEEFKRQIDLRNFSKFYQIWEEYCTSDTVEGEEFIQALNLIKFSDFATRFGKVAESAIPLWETLRNSKSSYEILKLILDLQTTNSPILAKHALDTLKKHHGTHPKFDEFIRLVGLRNQIHFERALSNFDLLLHMKKNNCVYHSGGWGTGEILDVSFLREELTIEFENIQGKKHVSFANAYKTLAPLSPKSFRARRFTDPDALEIEAKKDPIKIIQLLLEDLGPKTAPEIKDELCVLVIPEEEWTKWWQTARAKLKKCTLIETPDNTRNPFRLLFSELSHEERLEMATQTNENIAHILLTTYNFARDLPNVLKKKETRESVKNKIIALLSDPSITPCEELQVSIFMEHMLDEPIVGRELKNLIVNMNQFESIINTIPIIAFKKRVLVAIRENRGDWSEIFLDLLLSLDNNLLRDYILQELNHDQTREALAKEIAALIHNPEKYPVVFVWYFQKNLKRTVENLPFSDKGGQMILLEAMLILMHRLENDPNHRELVKKIYTILTSKRYAVIRQIIEGTPLDFIKEFLLLTSKSQTFTDQDKKIMQSLSEVVHPSLNKKSKEMPELDPNIIWTTEEGYKRTHDRIKKISTVEMIETAREIETARAHGDLRENSEYKFALEKRARLQSEMKTLSNQINRARIITPLDIDTSRVGIGSIVKVEDQNGVVKEYTILGPWDADPDNNVLSIQSRLAQSMVGCTIDQKFEFNEDTYKVINIRSIFENTLMV